MNSYELVKAALNNGEPDRLPVMFDCFGCNDTSWLPIQESIRFKPSVEGEDEWGCIWEKTEMKNMGQVKGHPFVNGIPENLKATKFPDYDDDSRYTKGVNFVNRSVGEGKYVFAGLFMVLFERIHSLYGFENSMCGLADDDERSDMERLVSHVVDIQVKYIENLSQRFGDTVHGVYMTDDFGTQQAAYVSSEFWMNFFYPHYKRIFDTIHNAGYDVWVHSCGKINEIIECYIKAGVDALNLQQPRALGIEEIGQRYRGRVSFVTLADIQKTLPTCNRSMVDEDVEMLMKHWASKEGGFIFSDYGNDDAIGINDPKIKLYMYRKFSEWSEKIYGNPLPKPNI